MCANSSCRTFAANPTAAFAAKYCAVMEQISPISPSAAMTRHILTMYPRSPFAIPISMIRAMTSGTNSSKSASSSLNNGPQTDSFRYSFMCLRIFLIVHFPLLLSCIHPNRHAFFLIIRSSFICVKPEVTHTSSSYFPSPRADSAA